MIPQSSDRMSTSSYTENFYIRPTRTYLIDLVNKRIIGTVSGRDSVMQFIQKCFSISKYAHEIYDWYYGNELLKIVGKSYDYAVTRIPNIFKEALLVDDRITDIRDFTFTRSSIDTIQVSCVIDTVYGKISHTQEVSI